MSKIIDLGDMFIVKKYITCAQSMTELETSNTIKLFVVGIEDGYEINCPSKERRDELFADLKKTIEEDD